MTKQADGMLMDDDSSRQQTYNDTTDGPTERSKSKRSLVKLLICSGLTATHNASGLYGRPEVSLLSLKTSLTKFYV